MLLMYKLLTQLSVRPEAFMVNKRTHPSQAVTHIDVQLTPSCTAAVLLTYLLPAICSGNRTVYSVLRIASISQHSYIVSFNLYCPAFKSSCSC
jgi:hypothetical protein